MATFLTENSSFGLDGVSDSNMLASSQWNEDFTGSQTVFPQKQHINVKLRVTLDSGDLAETSVMNYVLGEQYGKLPSPSADGHVFVGWYTAQNIKVEPTSLVELSDTELYGRWEDVTVNDGTFFDVSTDSTHNKVRIYSAAMYRPATFSTAIPEKVVELGDNITHVNTSAQTSAIYVDWGDGVVEKHLTSINKLVHTYENPGQYRAKVSNNITSIQFGSEIEMWCGVTDMNQALKDVVQLGTRVTVLPDYMFYHCGISSIDFLSTYNGPATSLPKYCFGYCESLTSISNLPTRFKSLGGYCFYYSGLSGVVDLRGTGLTGLTNNCTFYGCQASTYKFPATMSASVFGSGTFSYNMNLTAVDLPSTLTSICGFGGCSNLVSVSIPSGVKVIDYPAFKGCSRLSSVQCNTSALTGIYGYAFAGCQNLKSIVLPSTLTSIGSNAFAGCYNLSSITDLRLTAQTPTSVMFGGSTSLVDDMYTGYSTRGNNVLSIYADAEGYDQGQWLDPLQNPDKCGFSIQYIDPENVK